MKRRFIIAIAWAVVLIAGGIYAVWSRATDSGLFAPATHDEFVGKAYLKANAEDLKGTIVTPHLEQKIEAGKNILWCSTFQLAWNELCDLAGGPIHMESNPPMVDILNKRTASKSDLDEASYVAMAGLDSDDLVRRIRQELARKFHGQASPDLLNSAGGPVIAYAYLWKALPFEWAFDRSPYEFRFGKNPVEWFGIDGYHLNDPRGPKIRGQVEVLYYVDHDLSRSEADFIVELKTRSKEDRLILAEIPPSGTLGETVSAVQRRLATATPSAFADEDFLCVPVLDFDIQESYAELRGHPMKVANPRLSGKDVVGLQSIRFRLDEKGAVLKSEGALAMGMARNLRFDRPYLILLERKDAKNPYFALWVGNTELMIPGRARR